ncbi:MAG: CHRD domain-containing protein [bacterium]
MTSQQRKFGGGRRGVAVAALALALGVACFGVAAAAVINLTATLEGTQEVPPNASPATGTAVMVLDTDANTLDYNVTFSGLTAPQTNAHFHGPAAPGVNAPVRFGIGVGSPNIGVWNLTDADETMILDGLVYVNVHTTAFPGGEIRGQVGIAPNATEASTWGQIKSLYR